MNFSMRLLLSISIRNNIMNKIYLTILILFSSILRTIGFSRYQVCKIFIYQGLIISTIGSFLILSILEMIEESTLVNLKKPFPILKSVESILTMLKIPSTKLIAIQEDKFYLSNSVNGLFINLWNFKICPQLSGGRGPSVRGATRLTRLAHG